MSSLLNRFEVADEIGRMLAKHAAQGVLEKGAPLRPLLEDTMEKEHARFRGEQSGKKSGYRRGIRHATMVGAPVVLGAALLARKAGHIKGLKEGVGQLAKRAARELQEGTFEEGHKRGIRNAAMVGVPVGTALALGTALLARRGGHIKGFKEGAGRLANVDNKAAGTMGMKFVELIKNKMKVPTGEPVFVTVSKSPTVALDGGPMQVMKVKAP